MYRTDHAHRWERTSYEPMSSSYARTLYDDSPLMMTGETRPAEFGMTRSGDEVHVRRSGFGVDINTDSLPLDVLAQRLEPGSVVQPLLPGRCYGESCRQGRRACTEQCAEIEAARMGGAGMQEPSEPIPLAVSRRTPQHRWSRAADIVVAAIAVGALAGHFLTRIFG